MTQKLRQAFEQRSLQQQVFVLNALSFGLKVLGVALIFSQLVLTSFALLLWWRSTQRLFNFDPDTIIFFATLVGWIFNTVCTSFSLVFCFKFFKAELEGLLPAEFVMRLLLPRENREAIIGDLTEEAEGICERFGPKHAQIFWWCEVAKSVGPLLWRSVQRLLTLGVFDWIRRAL